MPSNRILYDSSKQLSKQVAIAVDRLLDSNAEMRRVKKILDNAQSGGDWAALAAELGLPANATGAQQAQDLWTIFSNAAARVDDPAVTECSRLDQG
jgi:hypothetical protein